MLAHSGRVLDGVKIECDTVEFLIPCLDRPELTRLLGEYLADQKPPIKGNAAQILQNAGEINVTLTTKLGERTAGE